MSALRIDFPPELVEAIAARVAEMVETPSPYLDVDAAAEYLACGRKRIYQLVETGRVRPHRDGRRLLFTRADLDAALQAPDA